MGWTIRDVKSGQFSGNTGQITAFSVDPAVNDIIVLGVDNWNSTLRAILDPTDTYSNVWAHQNPGTLSPDSNMGLAMFTAPVTTGGSTFRITINSTSTTSVLSGIAWLLRHSTAGAPVYNGDVKTNTGISTTPMATGATTPAPAADSIFLAIMAPAGSTVANDPSGWNAIANGFDSTMLAACRLTNNSPNQAIYGAYLIGSSAQSASWDEGGASDTWGAIALSIGPPVFAGTPVITPSYRAFPKTLLRRA